MNSSILKITEDIFNTENGAKAHNLKSIEVEQISSNNPNIKLSSNIQLSLGLTNRFKGFTELHGLGLGYMELQDDLLEILFELLYTSVLLPQTQQRSQWGLA